MRSGIHRQSLRLLLKRKTKRTQTELQSTQLNHAEEGPTFCKQLSFDVSEVVLQESIDEKRRLQRIPEVERQQEQ